jgi:hypothetical protein
MNVEWFVGNRRVLIFTLKRNLVWCKFPEINHACSLTRFDDKKYVHGKTTTILLVSKMSIYYSMASSKFVPTIKTPTTSSENFGPRHKRHALTSWSFYFIDQIPMNSKKIVVSENEPFNNKAKLVIHHSKIKIQCVSKLPSFKKNTWKLSTVHLF